MFDICTELFLPSLLTYLLNYLVVGQSGLEMFQPTLLEVSVNGIFTTTI